MPPSHTLIHSQAASSPHPIAGKSSIPIKEANENDKDVDDVKRERVETDDSTRLPTLHDIVAINDKEDIDEKVIEESTKLIPRKFSALEKPAVRYLT